ncbi:MAG: hypothetical protein ABH951_02315 [Patescibacteria group bacterium]
MSISKKTKKIISLTFLSLFLLSLAFSYNTTFSYGETLVLSVDKSSIRIGETAKITARATQIEELVKLKFSSTPTNQIGTLNALIQAMPPGHGKTNLIENLPFSSSTPGIFKIKASGDFYSETFQLQPTPVATVESNEITIEVLSANAPSTEATSKEIDANYYPLVPLPGLGEECAKDADGKTICIKLQPSCTIDPVTKLADCTPGKGFGDYLNILIGLFIGICAVLAMIMIVMGGIQYMTSELISTKADAKKTITNAILGLLLALAAFVILNTLNPSLLDIGLQKLDTANVTELEENNITDVGPGTDVNGTIVKIRTGYAANCSGGIVDIPDSIPHSGNKQICKDLLDRLFILQSKYPSLFVSSTIRGRNALSSCHYAGNPSSGNCADIIITGPGNPKENYSLASGSTNPSWGNFCVAVALTGDLNFANEASNAGKCQEIKSYKTYPATSGPHLHVNFIGQGTGTMNTSPNQNTPEIFESVTFDPTTKKVNLIISGYVSSATHKAIVYKTNASGPKIAEIPINNANTIYDLSLSYSVLKGNTAYIQVFSASTNIGSQSLLIN